MSVHLEFNTLCSYVNVSECVISSLVTPLLHINITVMTTGYCWVCLVFAVCLVLPFELVCAIDKDTL